MGFPCVQRDREILEVLTFLSGLIIIGFQRDQGWRECCSRQAACLRGLRCSPGSCTVAVSRQRRQREVVSEDRRHRAASAAGAVTGECRGMSALSPCCASEEPLHRPWQQPLPVPQRWAVSTEEQPSLQRR